MQDGVSVGDGLRSQYSCPGVHEGGASPLQHHSGYGEFKRSHGGLKDHVYSIVKNNMVDSEVMYAVSSPVLILWEELARKKE